MRRSFSTAPATMTEGAVAAKAGAGEIAPLAIPMSYGLKEFAILPMTIATNNIHLLIAGARWGIAGGLFLYMMIRPGEWASVRSRVASLATRALSVLCQMPARQLNNRRGEQPRTQTHRGSCAPLCTASFAGISRLRFLLWLQDDFFTRSFPHVPRQNYYDKVRPNAFWGSWVRL
jgi:hypothetical protein